MDHELNRIQYVIMNIMKKRKATDHMHSMSCEEIRDIENQNRVTTIYKHIRILEANGYVTKGAKIERAYGYILTAKGLAALPNIELSEDKEDE